MVPPEASYFPENFSVLRVYSEKFCTMREVRTPGNRVYVDIIEIFATALRSAQWHFFE
jgi:hypothetical protein